MQVFLNAFYFSVALYGLLYQQQLVIYFFAFVGVYTVLYILTPSGKFNPLRRKIMFASWSRATEGNINIKVEQDVSTINKYLETFDKTDRPSLTHVAVKGMALILKEASSQLNGKIVFGKFVPYQKIAVSVLVDINGGEDLASVTIEDVDKMSIKQIQEYIKLKGQSIKKNKGDAEHKKRTGPLKLLPPYIISLLLQVTQWVAQVVGISVPALGLKKDTFGAGCVTSLGMLGVKDAFVPFTPFMNCPIILAVGQVQDKAVVKDGKIVVAPIVNLNFTVDHRFIDGAKGKKLFKIADDLFDHPEKF